MKTAILTGFEAFGNYTVNPTEILGKQLNMKIVAEHLIHSLTLTTTVLSPGGSVGIGRKIIKEALRTNASVIISLGIASEVKGVRIEEMCINWVENSKYCTEFENRKPIYEEHPFKEKRRMPLQMWDLVGLSNRLSAANISLEMSEDAGSYCCNALMYGVLQSMQDFLVKIPFIFIHIPCTKESVSKIPDFDYANKILFHQNDLTVIVEELLKSYY